MYYILPDENKNLYKYLINKADHFRSVFIASVLSYFFVYGFEITHFTLSIDEEFLNNFTNTVSLGRWGHALLKKYLLPEPYIPFFSITFCLLTLSISATLSTYYLRLNRLLSYVFVIMMAALPQMAYQIEFENQVDTIAISFLLSTLSNIVFEHRSRFRVVLFILLNVLSVSIYQSIFLYGFSLLLISLTIKSLGGEVTFKSSLKKISGYVFLISVSVVINHFASRLVSSIYGIEISDYFSSMVGWGKEPFLKALKHAICYIKGYMLFKTFYGLNSYSFVGVWIALTSAALLWQKEKSYGLTIALSILVFLTSFSLPIIFGTVIVPRAMVQLPVVFAGTFVVFSIVSRIYRFSILISLLFLCFGGASSNKLFYSDYMARKADDNMASQVLSLIRYKDPQFDDHKTPVFFYGGMAPYNVWRVQNGDVFGASFFEWDSGNNRRIRSFIKNSNIADLSLPSDEQKKTMIDVAKEYPSWPSRDSVQLIDGAVLVKLSDSFNAKIN